MKFSNASVVENVVWTMKLADYPRSLNRSNINRLFNGAPPLTDEEASRNNIPAFVNVNSLEGTKLAHDARKQFYNAFQKPGVFFSVSLDSGPQHKRKGWSSTITREINRRMKKSLKYFEVLRSTFANVVLHGIGPVVWDDRHRWCPRAVGVEDVMIPSNTLLTMENLPFFAIYKQYTVYQLWKLTHGPKVDPGWRMGAVKAVMKWAEQETAKLTGGSWPEVWSPEKMDERIKGDGGLYASDAVPTVDTWDFYFWNDEGNVAGWNRRIVLDAWGSPGVWGMSTATSIKDTKNIIGERDMFLFNPGRRMYSSKIGENIHFQFGDLSAVAPFRYHSVRSLGFLIYSVCHLQNLLRVRFNSSLFESMLQYLRVASNQEDVERVLKINLIDKAIIPNDVEFMKAQDRWQVPQALVEMGLAHNREMMGSHASSYVQDYGFGAEEQKKTATEVMAEVNSASALVSSALMQAYAYQVFQYEEIARRFSQKNSPDQDVRKFRVNCLKEGVPEEYLDAERWNIVPEQVMGAGNKMLEMSIVQQLMAARDKFDPDPQRQILRDFTLAITDDPGRTEQLVPEEQAQVTDTVHDAQLASGVLMMGLPVALKTGLNHAEYCETLLGSMSQIIKKIEARGGMATMDELIGLQNMANHITEHIDIIAQDETEAETVKNLGDELGKAMNMVKAYGQRLMEQQKKMAQAQMQGNGGGIDPKDMAKVKAMQIQAQAKAQNLRESHAQKTAQRQVQWKLEQQRKMDDHRMDMQKRKAEIAADLQAQGVKTGAEIENSRMKMRSMTEEE